MSYGSISGIGLKRLLTPMSSLRVALSDICGVFPSAICLCRPSSKPFTGIVIHLITLVCAFAFRVMSLGSFCGLSY